MYGSPREYSEIPTVLDELNLGKVIQIVQVNINCNHFNIGIFLIKGEGVAYRGRILLEIQTVLNEVFEKTIDEIKHTDTLKIGPYLNRKKYKLHAAFFDATMISEIENPIEFEISIGEMKVKIILIFLKNNFLSVSFR